MPRSNRNRRVEAEAEESDRRKENEMAIDVTRASRDQMAKQAERDRATRGSDLAADQAKHDREMQQTPSQAKELEITDNAARNFASQVDHDIAQKEQELAVLRQQKINAENARNPNVDPNANRPGIVDTVRNADGDPVALGLPPRSVLSDQTAEANKSDPIGNTSFANPGGSVSPGARSTVEGKKETDFPSAEEDKTDGPTLSASAKASEDKAQSTPPTKTDTNQSKFQRSTSTKK